MAQEQVAARKKGDAYQALFFWWQAAKLLYDETIDRVVLEHDEFSHVDDVVVFYNEPGVCDDDRRVKVDAYQVKYHVDQRGAFTWQGLIDPKFVDRKRSLLKLLYEGYSKVCKSCEPNAIRLNVVSNWEWMEGDKLQRAINSDDRSLREEFFKMGDRSDLGHIRKQWINHLGIPEEEFNRFIKKVRFGFNFFGMYHLEESIADRLHRAGFKPHTNEKMINLYIALVDEFIKRGKCEFTADKLRICCKREGLVGGEPVRRDPKLIGIRSFMKFSENIESETDRFICFVKHFEGRYIKDPGLWSDPIFTELREFLEDSKLRREEHHLLLECHLSLAYAAGYILHRKSGIFVYPIQKGRGAPKVWKPSDVPDAIQRHILKINRRDGDIEAKDIVLALNISNDVLQKVEEYLNQHNLNYRAFISAVPMSEPGPSSLRTPDETIQFAEELQQAILKERTNLNTDGVLHIFASAPVGFMFYFGQLGRSIDPVQLYEYDFEGIRDRNYSPSLSFPIVMEERESSDREEIT